MSLKTHEPVPGLRRSLAFSALNAGRAPGRGTAAWIPPNTHDNDLWHVTGLPRGEHQLRLVLRADKDARSTGNEIVLERAVVYGE